MAVVEVRKEHLRNKVNSKEKEIEFFFDDPDVQFLKVYPIYWTAIYLFEPLLNP
jgi:hypothetical protein